MRQLPFHILILSVATSIVSCGQDKNSEQAQAVPVATSCEVEREQIDQLSERLSETTDHLTTIEMKAAQLMDYLNELRTEVDRLLFESKYDVISDIEWALSNIEDEASGLESEISDALGVATDW